jgi:hypothetical protein
MSLNWLDPMGEEEERELTDKMIDQVLKRGLDLPATLFLEAHKPFGNIGSHAVMTFSPFIIPFMGLDQTVSVSRLMATPGAIERLIQRLEDKRTLAQTKVENE